MVENPVEMKKPPVNGGFQEVTAKVAVRIFAFII